MAASLTSRAQALADVRKSQRSRKALADSLFMKVAVVAVFIFVGLMTLGLL